MLVALLPLASRSQVYVSDYQFSSSTGGFLSISSTGTEITSFATATSNASEQLPLQFVFPFGQDTCSLVTVGSTGQIGIGAANPTSGGYFSEHANDMSIIAPLGMPYLLQNAPGEWHVYYEAGGIVPDRTMTIEYNHMRPNLSSPVADSEYFTFQVILHETGDIEFVYDTLHVLSNHSILIFIREHGANAASFVSGSFSSPTIVHSLDDIVLSSTNLPTPGLTMTFSRIENSCPRPLNFSCMSVFRPDSIVFGWNTAPTTSMWELRYDTVGTPVGSMQNVIQYISDSFYVCSTMVAGGLYDAYLRTDCGGEQSFWEGPVTVSPGSYNMPIVGTNTIYACGGTIYDNGGASGNYSENCNSILIIQPSHPDSVVVISGTLNSESSYDYLYIYDGAGVSGSLLFQGSGSQTINAVRSLSGPLTVRFTSDGSVNRSGFALYVSCERAPMCRTVVNTEISHIAGASALFTWSLMGTTNIPNYFIVKLRNLSDPTEAVFSVTTNSLEYFFSELNPQTMYRACVSSVCGADTIVGDSVEFTTACLLGGLSQPSGYGNSQITGIPVYSSWGNSFCQSIFTLSELNDMGISAGPITGITYTWASAGSYNKDLVIFMGHTTNNTFTSFSPLTGSMTQVYQGPRTTSDVGTIEYHFDTAFIWDGVSNIVVSSFVNQPSGASHASSGFYGYSSNCGSSRSIYGYKDNVAYTLSNLTTNSGTSVSSYRPNISFIMPCDTTATCVAPNLVLREVTTDSVKLFWAPGYNETAWNIQYKEASEDTWATIATNITATNYEIGGLQPMTDYLFRVLPVCGGDSIYAVVSATTPCVPLTDLPFTEDFENFNALSSMGSDITNCWYRGTNYPSSFFPYRSTSYAHSGSASMYFYASSSYHCYLALPAFDVNADTLQISFAARKTSASYSIQVGVMTDPNDFSTFSPVAIISPETVNNWEMFEVPLSSYMGDGKHIALAGSSGYVYIDDIEVSYIPNCARPRNVAATATTTTATIHWDGSGSNFFEIEYGPRGFAHGSGIIVTSTVDSVTIYGLNHSSAYEVYVRSICSLSDTSNWSFVYYFNTQCGVIDSLPFSENFTTWGYGTSVRPNCWSCGGYSNYPYITTNNDVENNVSDLVLYMYSYSSNQVYASLPELDSVSYPINITQTVFRAWSNISSSYYSHILIVGVCSEQGNLSTFTPVDTVVLSGEPTNYEVAFDEVADAGKYITFVSTCIDPSAYYNYVYLDSVAIELIPSCQRPNRLRASAITANGATLQWNERNLSTTWQVEYGPHGFVMGTGTRVITSSNPLTVSGLLPSTVYDFYVRTICSSSDTSLWSATPGQFVTRQNPASVPYFYDFETSEEWGNWQTNSNTTINWYRGTDAGNGDIGIEVTGQYSIFVSADTGRTYGTSLDRVVNATTYRDFDFGPVDSSFTLTFRARAGGTPSQGYDGLMVFLVDPDTPVVASNANITSPWGDVRDLTPLVTVRVSSYWNTYSAVLDNISGVHRIAFFWFNQSTASTPFLGGPAAVDNVSINYIGCPRAANVRAESVTMASANIVWDGPSSAEYRVTCHRAGYTLVNELVNTNSLRITGLDPGSRYTVYVRRLCSDTDSATLSLVCNFTTKICNDAVDDVIGDTTGTTVSYYIPVNNYYNYSYTQQIVPSSEVNGVGEITSISFRYDIATASTSKTNCTIYMGHTSRHSFANSSDFVDPDSLRMVYTGNLNCEQGWNQFLLNTPFAYDGVSNLVIAVDDNSASYNGSNYTFNISNTGGSAITFYSDVSNPDPSSRSSLEAFLDSRSVHSFINQMRVEFCPPNACPPPTLREPIIRSTGVTLRWRNTSDLYQISYRPSYTTSWTTSNLRVTDTFYTIHSLYPMTDYVYQVRQHCDSTGVSNWVSGTFNSSNVPCLPPMDLHVTNVTNNKVDFAWTPEENNNGYRLHVFNSYFDKTITTYVAHRSVSGLDGGMTYYAAVRAECEGFDELGQWSDTISFTTDVCPDATDLTYSDLQGNSVVLDWVEGGRADRWEIQFGPAGFDQGTGVSEIADHHPYTLRHLIGETDYDIYVRAICGENFYSEHWSNLISITTPYSSISSATDDARVKLAPNPTSGDVTVTLPSVSGSVKVEVLDMSGREQLSQTLPSGTESVILATSQLSQGAYFVRVTGDSINTVKKLIVR